MFGDQSWISGTVSTLRSLAVAAGFSVALVGAAEATTFGPGFDLFSTTPGSFVDLTLPTGGVVGVVPLEGNPITGLGNTDTIVERLNGSGVPFAPSADAVVIDIELVALSLKSADPIDINGTLFDMFIFSGDLMGQPSNPVGTMQVDHSESNGGMFMLLDLVINYQVLFFEVGGLPLAPPDISINGVVTFPDLDFRPIVGPWCHDPAPMDAHTAALPANGFYAGVQCPGTTPPVKSEPIGHITSDEAHYTQAAMVSEPAPPMLLGVGLAVTALRLHRRA